VRRFIISDRRRAQTAIVWVRHVLQTSCHQIINVHHSDCECSRSTDPSDPKSILANPRAEHIQYLPQQKSPLSISCSSLCLIAPLSLEMLHQSVLLHRRQQPATAGREH
jgi:hypothetical protein